MADKPFFDPKDQVKLKVVSKRGEHYTVTGIVKGKETVCHIPAPSIERLTEKHGEALMRRGLLGTRNMEDRGDR